MAEYIFKGHEDALKAAEKIADSLSEVMKQLTAELTKPGASETSASMEMDFNQWIEIF
jgi:hypothetical protein